jgi:hypothetical protein
MGYIDFDGVRYWDARETLPQHMIPIEGYPYNLESDSRKRPDLSTLEKGDIEKA